MTSKCSLFSWTTSRPSHGVVMSRTTLSFVQYPTLSL